MRNTSQRRTRWPSASSDSELTAAKAVRANEAKDFSQSEAELVDVLQRAISIIQKETTKNPAFLRREIDTQNINIVVAALITRAEATAIEVDQSSRSETDLHLREQDGLRHCRQQQAGKVR